MAFAKTPAWKARGNFVLPVLLAVMASSMTGRTRISTVPALSVVSAFVPPCHRTLRTKPSEILASRGATLAPKTAIASNDEDCSGASTQQTTTDVHKSASPSGVEVWDGVFSPEVCRHLHELAIDHSERTTGEEEEEEYDDDDEDEDDSLDGSSIFVHKGPNRSQDDQLTPIEQALDSFLTAYYDREGSGNNDNREIVVEYWCRQEHLNLEAHADVDEVWFERSCKNLPTTKLDPARFRYPAIGHVLYLTKPTLGVGPTCVFPPAKDPQESNDNDNGKNSFSIRDEIKSVVTIPAVPGRVLRFPGNALHAVPKPADVWFSHGDSEEEEEEDDSDVDAEWDDDYDDDDEDEDWDDDDDEERSVILFNTWEASTETDLDLDRDVPVGPIGVPLDPMFHVDSDIGIVDMMMSSVDMDGVEVDEDFVKGMVAYAKQQKDQQLKDWRENYCAEDATDHDDQPWVYSKVHCQPRDSWVLAPIDSNPSHAEENATGTIRVPLMGDKLRRRYPKKKIRWTVPSSFEEGVKESEKPCEFSLMD